MIPDSLDYIPQSALDQDGPTCSVHAFFGLIQEHIQQQYNLEVEFDYYGEFDKMERTKRAKQSRANYLLTTAKEKGFKTKDGKYRVTIDSWHRVGTNPVVIQRSLYKYGPLLWRMRQFEDHSIKKCDEDNTIYKIPKNAKEKSKHMMFIRGYRPGEFKFQNSWGADATPRYVDFETFYKLNRYIYAVRAVRLTKI